MPYWSFSDRRALSIWVALDDGMFLDKIRVSGYGDFDTWIPADENEKRLLFDYPQKHEMVIVTHEHKADGADFKAFKNSFLERLRACVEYSLF